MLKTTEQLRRYLIEDNGWTATEWAEFLAWLGTADAAYTEDKWMEIIRKFEESEDSREQAKRFR